MNEGDAKVVPSSKKGRQPDPSDEGNEKKELQCVHRRLSTQDCNEKEIVTKAYPQVPNKEKAQGDSGGKWNDQVFKLNIENAWEDVNAAETNNVSYKDLSYAALIPILSIVFSSGFTLIPQHNHFDHPEYWYEFAMPIDWSILGSLSVVVFLRFKVFFKEVENLTTIKTCALFFVWNAIIMNTCIFLVHFIWTDCLGYAHPIPMMWSCVVTAWMFPHYVTIWFVFPKEYREDPEGRRKVKYYIIYTNQYFFACIERLIAIMLFLNTPTEFQPIWAILLPMWNELDHWILHKIKAKITNEKNREADLITDIELKSNYTAFLAVALGLFATETASYCILAVELIVQLFKTYGIFKINKKIQTETSDREKLQQEKDEAIQNLVLNELVDVLMPIVYVSLLMMAYFGPNATILGNVGCEKWMWKKISRLSPLLMALFRLFSVDLLALVINSLLLWKFSSVDTIKEMCLDLKRYWYFISATLGGAVVKV